MSVIITPEQLELTKIGLETIYMDEYDAPAQTGFRIFKEDTMDTPLVEEMIMAGFGAIPEWNSDGGGMAWDKPLSGDRIAFTATDYALQWSLSHKMIRDDLYNKVGSDLVKSAGQSTRHTVEQSMANIFNNGFTVTGPDTKYLFATDHPLLGGGTQGNRPASGAALSATTLQAALIALSKMKNHRGQPIVIGDFALVIPPDLRFIAEALIRNKMDPAATYNTENVMAGTVTDIIEWPYLTSATAWFLVAKPDKTKLKFFWREKPSYDLDYKDFGTKSLSNSVNFAYSVGYTAYDGVYGNPGT